MPEGIDLLLFPVSHTGALLNFRQDACFYNLGKGILRKKNLRIRMHRPPHVKIF